MTVYKDAGAFVMQEFGPHATIVGGITGLATYLAILLDTPAWIVFVPWAGYFLVGANLRAGLKLYGSFAFGLALGLFAAYGGEWMRPWLNDLALPCLVFVIAGGLTFFERVAPLNCIPAYYLGIVTYFASG